MLGKQTIAIICAGYVLMVIFGAKELIFLSGKGHMLPGLSLAFGAAVVIGFGYIKQVIKASSED